MQRRRKSIIGLACLMSAMLLFSSCGKEAEEEKQDTQTQADTEKEEPKEKEGQGNLNIISPQAYSNVDGLTLEPGTYISLIGKEAGTEYWKMVEKGAKQAVSELNSALGYKGEDKIKLNYSGPSESESVDEQINILDEELARYPNAVGIAIIDSNACSVQFDLATENGIPIVAFDSGSDYQGLQSLCSTNNTEAAQTAAVNLATALDNKGKVIVFVHDSNSTTARERQSGFADTLAKDYPEVTYEHMLVDNCAMQLVKDPKQFDVILTENMFGDILSDEASMVTGSIGMLSSASLNDTKFGLYEPSGGSAPDIAGKGIANPIATILSAAMMLRYTFDLDKEADAIENAVKQVLKEGYRTIDIMPQAGESTEGIKQVGTAKMGDLIAERV